MFEHMWTLYQEEDDNIPTAKETVVNDKKRN